MQGSHSRPEKESSLAVLMPAFNEEETIESAVQEVCRSVLNKVADSSLLVVDDGSSDATGAKLDRLAEADERIRVAHRANSGHGPSLVWALNQTDSTYVFLLDSDMQISLDCFESFWETIHKENVDGVFGVRQKRHDPLARVALSKFISLVLSGIFNVKLRDANVPCKLFRRAIWTELYQRIDDEMLMAPSLVISIFAAVRKYSIVNVPIVHRARAHGQSTLRLGKLVGFCWKAFTQLMTMKDKIV